VSEYKSSQEEREEREAKEASKKQASGLTSIFGGGDAESNRAEQHGSKVDRYSGQVANKTASWDQQRRDAVNRALETFRSELPADDGR